MLINWAMVRKLNIGRIYGWKPVTQELASPWDECAGWIIYIL